MDADLKTQLAELLALSKALRTSMETSVHADAASVWKYSTFANFARQYNDISDLSANTSSMHR